jgi:NTE family protein
MQQQEPSAHEHPHIAVACQGGGSHTAFTAGALKTLVRRASAGEFTIGELSGTSGGGIGALLAWHGLRQQAAGAWTVEQATALLDDFWHDLATQTLHERLANRWLVETVRLQDRGLLPTFQATPYALPTVWVRSLGRITAPRRAFVDLEFLLDSHIPFDSLAQEYGQAPRLLVGAVAVLSGTFKAFDSWQGEISKQAVLASATLPQFVPAQQVDDVYYWDGLFSQNPPIRNLVTGIDVIHKPDQIWIIRINPQTRANLPTTAAEITDRHNELAGNLSLNQELFFIEKVNQWLRTDCITVDDKKPIAIRFIDMSPAISSDLDYASKLDRSRDFIERLMADGEQQAQQIAVAPPAPA